MSRANAKGPARNVRRTPMAARGEPMIWLMGLALIVCFLAVLVLVGKVVGEGANTFWPRPIERVEMRTGNLPRSGAVFYGVPIREESFTATSEVTERLDALRKAGTLPPGAVDGDGHPRRRQYLAGNRDLTGEPFVWIPIVDIAATSTPEHTVLVERETWGVWLGTPTAVFKQVEVAEGAPATDGAGKAVERVTLANGKTYDRVYETRGEDETARSLPKHIAEGIARREALLRLDRVEIGAINEAILHQGNVQRGADRALAAAGTAVRGPIPWTFWGLGVAGTVAAGVGAWLVGRRRSIIERPSFGRVAVSRLLGVGAVAGLAFVAMDRPWRAGPIAAQEHARISAEVKAEVERLQKSYAEVDAKKKGLQREDEAWRVVIETADGKAFAPIASTDPDQPMYLSQVYRAVDANDLSWMGKLGVYGSRWGEFLATDPRDQNQAGGVFPVIFGTVMMTLLLSIIVVPFGVVAALYLREYAKQGIVTSLLRIAINNLAGVPSIVFGMFGLGFFCYTLGEYIDKGPGPRERHGHGEWWAWAAGVGAVVLGALMAGFYARPTPGSPALTRHRVLATAGVTLWLVAAGAAVFLAMHTPYFDGFFADRPDSTFGKRGMLWASLTLALLTLPVVIVATEEAVAAVPRSMREGSYGCGASKWQTIRRIVLPGAMPGIMTGMILAMARGAGEVAPLMLVGAMKLATELPFSTSFPFVHAERSFMHLGFHIFDLGFQSPDAEATRPLVWTTTLLLIMIVVVLNLAAILIRARLKAKGSGSAV
jgi:ABC-type phosphate transport system permease subunit/ABC-type phosphate transport system auxiliary subunit